MARVRTNIEIEERYVEIVKNRYGLRTKTEAVDFALAAMAGQPMTKEEILALQGSDPSAAVIDDERPTEW